MGTPEEKAKGPESPTPPSAATRPVTPLTDPTMPPAPAASGGLGHALQNLSKYLQDQSFNNPQGGAQDLSQGDIQFDSKGVDFGPWIRRFIATVRHNWNVPLLAQSLSGHVVITFNVHKDGRITDITVIRPSTIDSFNISAKNALLTSNPAQALPKDYPADPCFFTVTFFYNERPPIK
jgi:TonB family protein